jgi:hypothetical protein
MDKIFCGAGKTIEGTYGSFDALNLEVDVLLDNSYTAKNGKKYVNVLVSDRKSPDNFGNTKKITISKRLEEKQVTSREFAPDRESNDDLPF